jgi:hypothetical protein
MEKPMTENNTENAPSTAEVQSDSTVLVMRHPHDCEKCSPLGQYNDYDLYYCDQSGRPTVIARYGIDGEYRCGLEFGKTGIDPVLSLAYKMAVMNGHIAA